MSANFNSTNDKKNNSQTEKKLLDVYYYIDFDDNQTDVHLLEQCLQINVQVNRGEYIVNRFINCNNEYINTSKICDDDIIKRGLIIFNKMFRRLKLKTTTETWFIYMGNGCIQTHENVFAMLLNKYPCIKTCHYSINKCIYNIKLDDEKVFRLNEIKKVSDTFKMLFSTEKTIAYTNLTEN